jgi:hypothetical protein
MTFFNRQNAAQSHLADKVHEAIRKLGSVTLGDGKLTGETKLDARSILASVLLLSEKRKIEMTTTPKNEFLITQPHRE